MNRGRHSVLFFPNRTAVGCRHCGNPVPAGLLASVPLQRLRRHQRTIARSLCYSPCFGIFILLSTSRQHSSSPSSSVPQSRTSAASAPSSRQTKQKYSSSDSKDVVSIPGSLSSSATTCGVYLSAKGDKQS
jgi:hypothetical protein